MHMLLFLVPGIFASFLIALFITGIIAGVFWLFIFGDNTWPDWTDVVIPLCFGLVFLLTLFAFAFSGYRTGAKNSHISRKHILLSIGVSLALIAIIVLNYFKGEMLLKMTNPLVSECTDLCREHGFNGSSTSPKNSGIQECSCFDDTINEWITFEQ